MKCQPKNKITTNFEWNLECELEKGHEGPHKHSQYDGANRATWSDDAEENYVSTTLIGVIRRKI